MFALCFSLLLRGSINKPLELSVSVHPEAEFLDEIQTKVLRVPPCFSQSSLQLCLEIYISSNSRNLLCISSTHTTYFYSSVIVHCKGERRKARAGIFKQSMGARHRVGIGLSYRPARLNRWRNSFLGINSWAP
jgi:hypothetical protein